MILRAGTSNSAVVPLPVLHVAARGNHCEIVGSSFFGGKGYGRCVKVNCWLTFANPTAVVLI